LSAVTVTVALQLSVAVAEKAMLEKLPQLVVPAANGEQN